MNPRMRDDEFETLLGHALREQPASAELRGRISRIPVTMRPHWMMAILSPARIAACAGILSLALGFGLGASNAAVAVDSDVTMATALYAANEIGDL